jgi:cytochrome c oxidase cbb3-type subunit II
VRLDFHKDHRLLFGVVLGGFAALCLGIAIGPALWVNAHNGPLSGSQPLAPREREGQAVYVAEGCVYCHTQQVRPLAEDHGFGRPSVPGDYARLSWIDAWREPPAVLGTERTGPDLSDIGARQPSATWQYIHLYQPRAVVPASVMPAFPWLFRVEAQPESGAVVVPVPPSAAPAGGKVVATARAQALVAYLLALKQARLPQGAPPGGETGEQGGGVGASVYGSHCATCHQADGKGIAGAFPSLVGDAEVTAADPTAHVRIVLFGLTGRTIAGTAYAGDMPAWADQLSDAQIAAVVNHERASWGNQAPPVTAARVGALRRQGPAPSSAP